MSQKNKGGRPKLEIRGKKLGTVIPRMPTGERKRGAVVWICECTCCGGYRLIDANRLIHKHKRLNCKGDCEKNEDGPCHTSITAQTPESLSAETLIST